MNAHKKKQYALVRERFETCVNILKDLENGDSEFSYLTFEDVMWKVQYAMADLVNMLPKEV